MADFTSIPSALVVSDLRNQVASDSKLDKDDLSLSVESSLLSVNEGRQSNDQEVGERANTRHANFNIRRNKLVIWMLVLAFMLAWNGNLDVFLLLLEEKDEVFSMTVIKPWMVPTLMVELILTGIGFAAILLKMAFLHNTRIGFTYRLIMAFNNIRSLLILTSLPFGVYFFFTELSTEMRADLDKATRLPNNGYPRWNITQLERECCGFHSRHDWNTIASTVLDYNLDVEKEIKQDLENVKDITWPLTCCNLEELQNSTSKTCTESSQKFYARGCHDAEFFVMLDYFIFIWVWILLSLVISVFIRLWTDKLERSLLIFRPRQVM